MHVLRVAARHDDHHLAGVHPVARAVRFEQRIGDTEQDRVHQHLVGESLRALREASETLGLFAPKVIYEFVICFWANLCRGRRVF